MNEIHSNAESAPQLEVTIATPEDTQAIGEFLHNSWVVSYADDPRYTISQPEVDAMNFKAESRSTQLSEKLMEGTRRYWVIKNQGQIIACCVAGNEPGKHAIGSLYVAPDFQNKGLGSKLMQEALTWLGREEPIRVSIFTGNVGVTSLYKKLGFVEVEGPSEYDEFSTGKPVDAFEMVLPVQNKATEQV